MTDQELRDMVARIDVRLQYITEKVENMVTRSEFDPVKRVVYGAVGFVLISALGTLFTVVVVMP